MAAPLEKSCAVITTCKYQHEAPVTKTNHDSHTIPISIWHFLEIYNKLWECRQHKKTFKTFTLTPWQKKPCRQVSLTPFDVSNRPPPLPPAVRHITVTRVLRWSRSLHEKLRWTSDSPPRCLCWRRGNTWTPSSQWNSSRKDKYYHKPLHIYSILLSYILLPLRGTFVFFAR